MANLEDGMQYRLVSLLVIASSSEEGQLKLLNSDLKVPSSSTFAMSDAVPWLSGSLSISQRA